MSRALAPASGFQPGTLTSRSTFHKRRAEQSKPTAGAAHSLAARPSTLAGSLSMSAEPRIRTGNLPALNGAPLPVGLDRRGADTGSGTRDLHLGKLALCPLSYICLEPFPGADPGLLPYEGRAAAVRGGKATGTGIEPVCSRVRAEEGCQTTHPVPCAEGGIRTRTGPSGQQGLSLPQLPVTPLPHGAP